MDLSRPDSEFLNCYADRSADVNDTSPARECFCREEKVVFLCTVAGNNAGRYTLSTELIAQGQAEPRALKEVFV